MTHTLPDCFLCPAPSITWTTERRCTLVVDEASAAVFQLTGLSEVLWDCLVQGFSYARIIQILAEMRGDTLAAAEAYLVTLLHEWRELGLVQEEEGEAHG